MANLKFMLFPFGYFMPVGPAVVLGVGLSGTVMRLMRAQMLEVLRQDYVRTAWAKGLEERSVVGGPRDEERDDPGRHGDRAAGADRGRRQRDRREHLQRARHGQWFFQSIGFRDYTAVQTIALVTAILSCLSNLVVDITYAYLDPRIRYS